MDNLIITADDFGLDPAVNEAVEKAHRDGILSAASLMVAGPAAADAIARARRLPGLRVGLHLVLVEGAPTSATAQASSLLDGRGMLRTDMVRLAIDMVLRPTVRRQLAREIRAQFAAFRGAGLPLDHVNAHKHFHLHPLVSREIIESGLDFGLRAMRIPAEPARVLARIEPNAPYLLSRMMAAWASAPRLQAARAGLTTPAAVFGLAWSGGMTASRLAGLLRRLPAGIVEIYLHPALADSFPGSAPGYRYADEFAALVDPECIALARRSGRMLGGYDDVSASIERRRGEKTKVAASAS